MSWTYSQSTGQISRLSAVYLGYSGAFGFQAPQFQTIPDEGPIPQGRYRIGAATNERGPLTLPLTPDPANEMFGRSGFLIHGDNSIHPGHSSEGCIILSEQARQAILDSGDTDLTVTV